MPYFRGARRSVRWLRGAARNLATVVLGALVVFAVAAGATLHLKHVGEQGIRAERDLQAIASQFHAQDALEWRVISGRVTPEQVVPALAASRARSRSLLTRASGEGLSARERREVLQLHETYVDAVDEELRLLAAGEHLRAEALDEERVDPAFEAALDGLAHAATHVSADATRARRLSDLGILLTMGLALLVTALLHNRRRLADVRRQQERRSEARYRALVDQSADVVVVIDRGGSVRYLSPSAERVLARRLDDASASLDLLSLVHPDDRELVGGRLQAVSAGRPRADVELRLAVGTGQHRWRTFEVSIQDLCQDPAVEGIVLTGHDITERQVLQQELEHRALHDTLTGLPNRALLADRFAQALRDTQRAGTAAGLLLIDLDRFKEINDALGHHYGDQLLVQVGPRLAGVLRESDTVARLGGDEFAVLLSCVDGADGAVRIAEKLQSALGRSFLVEGVALDIEASIGVVVSGLHGTDASTLMQRADIAMYVAKQRNLGVFTYDPDIDIHTPERLALLGDLRRALHTGELFLHYQPKVSLSTGEVCGAEALLRWQHPVRGLIPPDAFIPLAENTGLIGPLTCYVLGLALAQARDWCDQGMPLQVSVNLSARNLLDPQLDRMVAGLLARHGVPAELLQLEITESAIMTEPARARDVLQRLALQGIAVSIDDFGAGYTSLGQLRNLPISELKVDRSFVMTMETDQGSGVIVRSVVDLGHNLGFRVVAEGVESAAIIDRLSTFACDIAQGYHISRPLSAEAFQQFRAAWPGLAGLPVQAAELSERKAVRH
ncbi:MAG: hypothetical protein QOI54_2770 [Actinomycetota bacterium]|jgi:diguanylate cyclase (GGDEF)-like protein/PAS domain S-box-containing protein|nr:hypothetical protein [Actinomycetota bacterium]